MSIVEPQLALPFYFDTRNVILYALTFLSVFGACHGAFTAHFPRVADDGASSSMVVVVVFLLALVGMWLLLLWLTLLVSSPHLQLHWLLYFIDRPFVRGLWTFVTRMTTLALGAAPVAYFYDEAHTGARRKWETAVVSILFVLLTFGSGLAVYAILLGQEVAMLFPHSILPVLSFMFHVPGLVLCLGAFD